MTLHSFIYLFVSSFMALFPVLDPIGNGFIVNGFLTGLNDAQRKTIVRKITWNCLLIGVCSLVVGHVVLWLFNLAVPVIQLAGGFIIAKTGLGWLSGSDTSSEEKQEANTVDVGKLEQKIFYPISFPICFGPGCISVVFALMATAEVKGNLLLTGANYLIITLVIAALCFIMYLIFAQGTRLINRLGRSGNLIINKLIAFFTFCIGLQIMLAGISKIFHITVL